MIAGKMPRKKTKNKTIRKKTKKTPVRRTTTQKTVRGKSKQRPNIIQSRRAAVPEFRRRFPYPRDQAQPNEGFERNEEKHHANSDQAGRPEQRYWEREVRNPNPNLFPENEVMVRKKKRAKREPYRRRQPDIPEYYY